MPQKLRWIVTTHDRKLRISQVSHVGPSTAMARQWRFGRARVGRALRVAVPSGRCSASHTSPSSRPTAPRFPLSEAAASTGR